MDNKEFLQKIEKVREHLNLTLAMSDFSGYDKEVFATLFEAVDALMEAVKDCEAGPAIVAVDSMLAIVNAISEVDDPSMYTDGIDLLMKIHELMEEEFDLYLSEASSKDFEQSVADFKNQFFESQSAKPATIEAETTIDDAKAAEDTAAGMAALEAEVEAELAAANNLAAEIKAGQNNSNENELPSEFIHDLSEEMLNDEIMVGFIEEAGDGLEDAEKNIMVLEKDVSNQDVINSIFRAMHTIKGTSRFIGLNELGKIAHHAEDLLSLCRDGSIEITPVVIDGILQACDCVKQMLQQLSELIDNKGDISGVEPIDLASVLNQLLGLTNCTTVKELKTVGKNKKSNLGDILVNEGDIAPGDLNAALDEQERPLGQILVDQGKITPEVRDKALSKQQNKGVRKNEVVKVPAGKLDELSELVGELVIAFSILSQNEEINAVKDREAVDRINQIEKITEGLRDRVLEIRMFPLDSVFLRLERQVRDLSRSCGKNLELIIKGRDTKLDKSLIDEIFSPLMHLVRNSIDHGIESPEERKITGKMEEATLMIKAYHKGDSVQIEVFDDGKGLNKKRIFEKAVEKGLVKPDEQLTDKEIFELIMRPGFSTAEKITDVSGRGVGMDVVKKTVESLMGKVVIESVWGEWTRFTLALPLTTSIIEGLVVAVGEKKFIAPLLAIKQTVKPPLDSVRSVHDKGGEVFYLHGEVIPILRLYELYDMVPNAYEPSEGILIIVEHDERKYGVMVDELLHRQQIVIKRLSSQLGNIEGISGGTILGNGQVGFVLDMDKIVQSFVTKRYKSKVAI